MENIYKDEKNYNGLILKQKNEVDIQLEYLLEKLGFDNTLKGKKYFLEIVKDMIKVYEQSLESGETKELLDLMEELDKAKSPSYVELVKFYFETSYSDFYQSLILFFTTRNKEKVDDQLELELIGNNDGLIDIKTLSLSLSKKITQQQH